MCLCVHLNNLEYIDQLMILASAHRSKRREDLGGQLEEGMILQIFCAAAGAPKINTHLGMVNMAPIKMVMTGGWFIIVFTTLMKRAGAANQGILSMTNGPYRSRSENRSPVKPQSCLFLASCQLTCVAFNHYLITVFGREKICICCIFSQDRWE